MSDKTLREIQAEIGYWAGVQFGTNVSKDETALYKGAALGPLPPLLGIVEELGELARVYARKSQGRGYQDEKEAKEAKEDAIADLMVFLCDLATREEIELTYTLNKVWAKVKLRRQQSWAADKAKE